MKIVGGLLAAGVLTLLALTVIQHPITDSATDPVSASFTAQAPTATSATVTLAAPHWYSNTTELTVTSDIDGDVTSNATLGADRRTLSVTGLTSDATGHDLTVMSLEEIDDSTVGIILKVIPFLVVLAGLSAMVGNIAAGGMVVAGKASSMTSSVESLMLIFVGVILIPVVLSFVDEAQESYVSAPEYIGVLSVLSLVTVVYVLSLLAVAAQGFGGQARRMLGSSGASF